MVERTEELKREIESTRDHMGTTLDAIGDRVSPGRVVERRWNRVRQSSSRFGESIMGTPRQVGVQAKQHIGTATGATSGAASSVGETVSGAASSVGDAVSGAPDQLRGHVEGNPLAAGAVAFGLGVLLGSMMPTAEAEADVASQLLEPVQEQARSLAQDVAQPVKEQVTEAVDQTKAAATDAAAQVKDQAASGAQQVGDHAAAAGSELKDQAKGAASDVREQGSSS